MDSNTFFRNATSNTEIDIDINNIQIQIDKYFMLTISYDWSFSSWLNYVDTSGLGRDCEKDLKTHIIKD